MTEYKRGYIDGLRAFAWWKNGKQILGSCEADLKHAIEFCEEIWNFDQKQRDDKQ